MDSTIYKYIFRYSMRQQITLVVLTLISFPFLYYSLEVPKWIINKAIGGTDFPQVVMGVAFEQIPYLALLCGIFLVLVLINGTFKYVVNVYKGLLGERMLRRLRYDLYARILRFPLPTFRKMSQGEIIPMITAEVEPLGGFFGDSVSLPVFQGGTLLTILMFLLVQQPIMGLAAVALYPLQIYLIPRLQKRVNALGKQRVQLVRHLAGRIGETVSGVEEIHTEGTARLELADFTHRLGRIFDVRYDIYRRKFFIKFLNNFLAQLGPFFFFAIGGYLVIKGMLTLGALVAALSAYKEMYAPWKQLLTYYQQQADARIKYDQVISQFEPAGLRDEALSTDEPDPGFAVSGELAAANVTLTDDNQIDIVDSASIRVGLDERVAVVGRGGSGRDDLALLLARLIDPSGGRLTLGSHDMAGLPESVTSRYAAYVGPHVHLFSASLGDNLLYGLKNRPLGRPPGEDQAEAEAESRRALAEAQRAGNSEDDITADWIDYSAAGARGPDDLLAAIIHALGVAEMSEDVFAFGLRGVIDPKQRPDTSKRILTARGELGQRLKDPTLAGLVEPFDRERYNTNATLGENLLFGTPVGDAFDMNRLAENEYVLEVLDKVGLTDDLLSMGQQIAATMVELFADLPPEHELFQQFSFISADDLPEFQTLLSRVDTSMLGSLKGDERTMLLSLPFKLIPARHRLGMIDDSMSARLLEARHAFALSLPLPMRAAVEFFEVDAYNAASTIQDNILFGKLAYGQAEGAARVGELLAEVVDSLDLRQRIIEVGLDYQVGIAGARLTAAQRQKLAIARSVLKRPQMLILSDATAALDTAAQSTVTGNLLTEFKGRGLIWSLQRASLAEGFDRVLVMQNGRIVEQGKFDELSKAESRFMELVRTE